MRVDRRRLLIALLLASVVALGGSPVQIAPPATAVAATRYLDAMFAVDVQRDVVYGTATTVEGGTVELRLDLYLPRGDTATSRPVFVYAHGGFFWIGGKEGATAWATRMAQRGYVAASIDYRLGPSPVTFPVDSPFEVRVVQDATGDMQTAVRWFRSQASELRIDPDRIGVAGSSAGAVMALGVAVGADAVQPGSHVEFSSAVCTAVSFAGANDPAAIGADDAGAIFFHGSDDDIVPTSQARATRDAMVAAGLPVSWNEFPGEGHDLSDASALSRIAPTVRWFADRVANAPTPCSPAVAQLPRVPAGRQTTIVGEGGRSGVVSLVSVDNTAPGYAQVLPCGSPSGGSSNLNTDAAGQIRSALAVVRFGADGSGCVFNQMSTHLVVDLQGWFAAGAFDDVDDVRLLDTRDGMRPPDGSTIEIRGRPDTTGLVSIVATEAARPGFVQVLPCGAVSGGSSNVNVDAAGQTRSNLALVRFGADGRACLFVQRSTHLVADLQGYLSDVAVDDVDDARLIDTRGGVAPRDGSVTEVRGRPGSTAVVSLVATESAGPGYVQVLDCGAAPGGSSNLNVDRAGQTIAGMAFVRFGADGRLCVYTQRSTHLLVDVQAYLTADAFVDVPDRRLIDTRTR
ncbi:MAG: alpha/beta hydrolase [Acidimicrobiales bacterium]|nr:alpha/beta hydrolase [Acidimicrobiales bacterium]MCB9394380.1 alpha/beta hydrolase [Acidimicrobiaceae bacterium]